MMKTRAMRVLLASVVVWCVVGVGAAVAAPGDLDATFGTGGTVTTAINSGADRAYGVAVDSQGRVILVGSSHNGSDYDIAVVRYNADGSLDTSFSTDGIVTTDFGGDDDYGLAVVVDSQDRVIVSGGIGYGSGADFAVVRYTPAGVLDSSFDGDGKLLTDFGSGEDYGQAVAVDSADRIVVAGYASNGTNGDFAVARYNTDGSLDTSFDSDGKLTTAIGSHDDEGDRVIGTPSSWRYEP